MVQYFKNTVFSLPGILLIANTCVGQFADVDTLHIVFTGGQSNMLCLRADASLLPDSNQDSTIAFYYHQGLKPNQTSFPNPFNQLLSIYISLPFNQIIDLQIMGLSGKYITHLAKGYYSQDEYHFFWNGQSSNGYPVPSGIYIVFLSTDCHTNSMKISFIK